MLEEADLDVLILPDCCAAASSADGHGKGTTEIIAACGFEAFAPGVGEHSFTRSLIEELRWYGQRLGPISISFLHNKVLARAKKSWNPRYVADGTTSERRRTPIYIHLADKSNRRYIELTPLVHPPAQLEPLVSQLSMTTQSTTSSTTTSEGDVDMSDYLDSSPSSLDEVFPDPKFDSPKVLVSIALEEEQTFSTQDWINWLKAFPAVARSMHVEGVYRSDSTLLLLLLPVAIWDLLSKNRAISFVAFVRSRDLMKTKIAVAKSVAQQSTTSDAVKTASRPMLGTHRKDRDSSATASPYFSHRQSSLQNAGKPVIMPARPRRPGKSKIMDFCCASIYVRLRSRR